MTTDTTTNQSNPGGRDILSPLVIALGALLAVQLLAALLLNLGGSSLTPAASQGPLLAFVQDKVTKVRIEAPDQEPLVLEKTDGAWRLPALGGFPAAELKVSDLLTKLGEIQRRIPVATSEAALGRFKVADDGFERRVTLEGTDGPLATVYLGDSPGFRRLYVRAGGDTAVYEADLALPDASEKADDWTQKTLLQLLEDDIKAVAIKDIELTRNDDGWQLAGLAQGETLDQPAAADLVHALAGLTLRGVLGTEAKPDYGQDAPELTWKVTVGDKSLDYRLSKLQDGEDYVLKVSDQPYYFRLSRFDVQGALDAERAKLLKVSGDAGKDAGGEQAAPSEGTKPATPGAAPPAATSPPAAPAPASGAEPPAAPGEPQPLDVRASAATSPKPVPEGN